MLFDSLPENVRDALYTAIGLPSVALQELQARQQTLTADLDTRLVPIRTRIEALGSRLSDLVPTVKVPTPTVSIGEINARFDERIKSVEGRVNNIEARFEEAIDSLQGHLPESAREVVAQARGAAKDARTQLRSIVDRAA